MPLPPLQPSMREKDRGMVSLGAGREVEKSQAVKASRKARAVWGCWNQAELGEPVRPASWDTGYSAPLGVT